MDWRPAAATLALSALLAAVFVPASAGPGAPWSLLLGRAPAPGADASGPASLTSTPGTDTAAGAAALQAGPVYRNATALRAACGNDITCVEPALARLMRQDGQRAAFDLLAATAQGNAALEAQEHNIAHALGRAALAQRGNVRDALADCPYTMASGCFHGVLESYLAARANVTGPDLQGLCVPGTAPDAQFSHFQCLHGLGHGLDMYADHDWSYALGLCDLLDDPDPGQTLWQRSACYAGVFMENIVGDQDNLRGGTMAMEGMHGMPGMHAHNATGALPRFNATDPLYPCDAAMPRYWSACYLMQSAMLMHNHPWDYAYAFRACDGAPEEDISICYQSVGRDISGNTLRDPHKSLHACQLPADRHPEDCIVGVVKDYVNTAGQLTPAGGLCKLLDGSNATACWMGAAEMAVVLGSTPQQRAAACRAGDAPADCMEAPA